MLVLYNRISLIVMLPLLMAEHWFCFSEASDSQFHMNSLLLIFEAIVDLLKGANFFEFWPHGNRFIHVFSFLVFHFREFQVKGMQVCHASCGLPRTLVRGDVFFLLALTVSYQNGIFQLYFQRWAFSLVRKLTSVSTVDAKAFCFWDLRKKIHR